MLRPALSASALVLALSAVALAPAGAAGASAMVPVVAGALATRQQPLTAAQQPLPRGYALPGMLQTHAATTSVFAWLAVYAPPGAQTPSP